MHHNFIPGNVYNVVLNNGIEYKSISFLESIEAEPYSVLKFRLKGRVDVFTAYKDCAICVVYIEQGTYKQIIDLSAPVGYVLMHSYPGCTRPLGYFEPFTTGYFSNFPLFWFLIYKNQLGHKPIIVKTNTHTFEIIGFDKTANSEAEVYVKITLNGKK